MRFLFTFIFLIAFVTFSQNTNENLIKNGDFSDSTLTGWNFNPNGSNVKGSVENGRFLLTIENQPRRDVFPQLSQRNIPLKAGEGYRLSFKASSSDTAYITIKIEGRSKIIYNDSSSLSVRVFTNATVHTLEFFVEEGDNNSTIVFSFNVNSAPCRISLDSVFLTISPTPMIKIISPSVNTRWIAGTERKIEWLNSGKLDLVKIKYSADGGNSWNVITNAATNKKSYWWKIPSTLSGDKFLIIVSDTSEKIADTSEMFKIIGGNSLDIKEMVKNGDFLDTTGWKFSVNGNAKAKGSFTDDMFVIEIFEKGNEPWMVKLEQTGLKLEQGMMYRFSFDAYASHERDIFANVGGDNGSPAWSIYGGDTIPVRLTTTKTRYYQTFIMKYPTSGNIRVEFNCANDTGKVFIDNVSLIPLEAGKFFIISPAQGQILKAGSKFNIEWQMSGTTALVDLEYSLDSGVTWQTIVEGIDNLGILAWNVPTESSEKCFIRIKDAETDSVIGMSSIFQINKFGAPVKTGELIVNGGFTNSQQGWNVSYSGAEGVANFKKGMFELTINEPGNELSAIVLSQGDLPVLQGKEYTLSFEAFTNGERSIGVALINSEDKQAFLDTIINLPTVQEKITLKITPPSDAILTLEFRMGGSYAGVFIDNVSFFTGQIPNTYVFANVKKIINKELVVIQYKDRIEFSLPSQGNGVLSIYSLNGTKVNSFYLKDASKVNWDLKGKSGYLIPKGSYIALFSDGKRKIAEKFVIK